MDDMKTSRLNLHLQSVAGRLTMNCRGRHFTPRRQRQKSSAREHRENRAAFNGGRTLAKLVLLNGPFHNFRLELTGSVADGGPADRQKLEEMCVTFLFHELSDMEPTHAGDLGLQSAVVTGAGSAALPESDRKSLTGSDTGKDVQQMFMIKEEVPPEGSLDQESLHIKEEQEKMWISHEGEQLNGLKEAVIIGFPFTAVPVKTEVKEEEPPFLQLHQSWTEDQGETEPPASSLTQIKTETDGEECGGSEPARKLEPDHAQINTDNQASGCTGKKKIDSQMRVSKWESFGCDFCWKRFSSKATLKEHVRAHTGETTFDCDVCGKAFSQRSKLNTHMKIHSGVSPFGCDVCGKTFKSKTYFEVHMRVHTGEKPFGCDVCGKRFRAKAKLKRHLGVHSGEKPHGCDVCGKRFREKTQVNAHMRVHAGAKRFRCDVQDVQKLSMIEEVVPPEGSPGLDQGDPEPPDSQMGDHTIEKPFGCDVCGKRFPRRAKLNTHMRVHTGEKPFSCESCGKRFSAKANFQQHMRIHQSQSLFGCNVCGRRFYRKHDLERHMSVHMLEKPFGCDVCGKRFTRKEAVKKHSRVHLEQS